MTEKNDDSAAIAESAIEEKKNFKDVIPEKVKHPSTWITAGLVVFYLFLLGFLDLVLWIIAGTQFLFTLFTKEPNLHLSGFSIKLRNYIIQIIDFVTYSTKERPFPFNPFPTDKE
tara:strand:- start:2026 stop:2370 length:345 start_codon:yes stop_codon:yes gene_type:complete